jgi:putative ABC transport system permease protein
VNLSASRYSDPARQAGFFDAALQRIETLPGVVSAAVSDSVPLTGINDQGGFAVEGMPDPAPGMSPHANKPRVSSKYFDTMGIRLIEGRLFDRRDRRESRPVAIVSDLAVKKYWPAGSPVGKRLATEWVDDRAVWREIVGVVESTRHFGVEAVQKAEVYLPYEQAPSPFMILVVRTEGDPAALVAPIRAQIAAIDPDQATFAFRSMQDLLADAAARRRFQTVLVTTFASLALLLAAIGVYGVMGYLVAQRRRDIGVRLALGAPPADVVGMILRRGLWLTLPGIAVGLAGAFALSGVLASFLFGVSPLDRVTYAGVSVLVFLTAMFATYLPSRLAARLDPLIVLRDE